MWTRTAWTAAWVFAGCSLGALADQWLQFPGIGTAILFVPYAVVTSALLRTPPRRWWIILVAASAADYLPHRAGGASISFVLLAEMANHLRACVAAACMRRFMRDPLRFDTMTDMVVFLGSAVFVAPAIGALAGTAIVVGHGISDDSATIWQEWWLSNAITALTLVPLLTADVRRLIPTGPGPTLWPRLRRFSEAALVSVGLLAAGASVFMASFNPARAHPARLFWPLPFLLWTAVRFGPRGTSAALLGVSSLSIWGAVERHGPFVAQSPGDNLLELQLFLLGVSVPLLLLAAVFRQQQQTAAALEESRRLYQSAEQDRRQMEVQRAVDEVLRDADRRKDEFLATLGHELRNPLAPIGIALEIMRTAPSGSAENAWGLESIRRQLRHMTRLLDDLLDISRITLGKIRLQPETVDLAKVVANAVEATRPLIDTSGHALTVDLPASPVRLRGDEIRLTQIVANLLNNAAKYTEPGGGRIEVSLRRQGEMGVLSVRDNGIGIPADSLERVFEPFTQIAAGEGALPGGLGIGLALVKRLVELHGGTVQAHSSADPPRGTEVVVRLPGATSDLARAAPAAATQLPAAASGLRILAVDDNADVVDGLAQVLALWGHTVRTAPDGSSALEAAASFTPDVVLIDLGLPKIDGLEVARRLLKSGRAPALLISMSGFGQDQATRGSHDAGFHHHLVKPIDMDSLRSLLALNAIRPGARAPSVTAS